MPEAGNSPVPVAALAVAVLVVLLLIVAIPLSVVGRGSSPVATIAAADARIEPVARLELAVAPKAARGPRTTESIYAETCAACHGTGVGGAPKKGDKAAWAPRLAVGIDGLVKSAGAGKNAMPPRGGLADLGDAELKAVIALMTK